MVVSNHFANDLRRDTIFRIAIRAGVEFVQTRLFHIWLRLEGKRMAVKERKWVGFVAV